MCLLPCFIVTRVISTGTTVDDVDGIRKVCFLSIQLMDNNGSLRTATRAFLTVCFLFIEKVSILFGWHVLFLLHISSSRTSSRMTFDV